MVTLIGLSGVGLAVILVIGRSWQTRVYGALVFVLTVFATNKPAFGLTAAMWVDTFSPLSSLRWVALACLAATALRRSEARRWPATNGLWVGMAALALVMLMSSAYSPSPTYTAFRSISILLLFAGLIGGVRRQVAAQPETREYSDMIYWLAWIVLVPPFAAHLLGLRVYPWLDSMDRYVGVFQNPNTLGAVAALIGPHAVTRLSRSSESGHRALAGLTLVALAAMVWLSGSRGGLLALLAGSGVSAVIVERRSTRPAAVVMAVLLVAMAGAYTVQSLSDYFSREGRIGALEEERRYEIWTGVWPEFMKTKWLGRGFAVGNTAVSVVVPEMGEAYPVHNSYLEHFGDLGLVGVVLLGAVLLVAGREVFAVAVFERRIGRPEVSAADLGVLAGGLVSAFMESWLFSVGNPLSLVFWTSMVSIGARWSAIAASRPRRMAATRWAVVSPRAIAEGVGDR